MISMTAGLPVCAPSPNGERVDSGGAVGTTTLPWRPSRRFIPTIPNSAPSVAIQGESPMVWEGAGQEISRVRRALLAALANGRGLSDDSVTILRVASVICEH